MGRVSLSYAWQHNGWRIAAGTGYGNRAPSVTEAYGYFLNNAFDRYDYIGNPHLKNESAVELNISGSWKGDVVDARLEVNAFLFQNYIIGTPDDRLSPMTIGAAGVKVYQNLKNAQIVNASLVFNIKPLPWLRWNNRVSYSYGKESTGARLPQIAPLTYTTALKVLLQNWEGELGGELVSRQDNYSSKYGETPTPGYAVWRISAGYQFPIYSVLANIHIGVDNLFDRYYSTYSDWNHIPQKGRNIYINVSLQI